MHRSLPILLTTLLSFFLFPIVSAHAVTSVSTTSTARYTILHWHWQNLIQIRNEINSKKISVIVNTTQMPSITSTPVSITSSTASPTPTFTPTPTQSQNFVTIITSSPVATLSPTSIPTPTTQSNNPTPTNTSSAVSLNDVQTYIMNAINDYRKSQGLGTVSPNAQTCDFAKTRAHEITTSFTHDGFNNRVNSHTLPYPSYSLVTENIAMTSDYKQVVTMWANSPGHAANMRADTPYVCVAQDGDYYAYEGWKPL